MKRRSVLKAGLATSLLPLLGIGGVARALDLQSSIQLKAILSDRRFPMSSAFGARAAAMGIPHLATNGDITTIWLKHLDPLWREGKASVMGLTTQDQLFCLERLAWDRGMKVIMRVEHQEMGLGEITHTIDAPALLTAQSALALQRGDLWPSELATLMGSCSPSQCIGHRSNREVISKGRLGEHLVSWVIVPASQVS